MKVNGQLGVAQLENLTGANPSLLPLGRIWADITTPSAATMKFYDGSNVRTVTFNSVSGGIYDAGVTGQSKTINWDSGVIQRVRITSAWAKIAFSGTPADGVLYTLLVDAQTVTGKIYFDVDHEALGKPKIFVGYNIGMVRCYTFMYQSTPNTSQTTGIYGTIGVGFSAGAATGLAIDLLAMPDSIRHLEVTTTGSTVQSNTYQVGVVANKGQTNASIATTVTSLTTVNSVRFHPTGRLVAYAGIVSPYIAVYEMGSGTRVPTTAFSDPGTVPTGQGKSVDWHPSGLDVVICHQTTPFVSAYPISANAFGTKYTNPVSLPTVTTNPYTVAFAPSGDFVALVSDLAPYLQCWEWVQGTGWGSRITDPVGGAAPSTATIFSRRMAWRPQTDWIVYGLNASPWLYQVPFTRSISGTFGSSVVPSLTGTPPTTAVICTSFSPCGKWLALGCASVLEPLRIYPFDASAGVDFANPITVSSAITQACRDIVWDPDGSKLYFVTDADAVRTFVMPFRARNWVRVNDH